MLSSPSTSLFPTPVLLFEFSITVNNAMKVLSYPLPKYFLNQPCFSLSLLSELYRGIFPGVIVTLWAQPSPFLHFSSNPGHLPKTQIWRSFSCSNLSQLLTALRVQSEHLIIYHGAYLTFDLDWVVWLPSSLTHWSHAYCPPLDFLSPECFPPKTLVPVWPPLPATPSCYPGLVNSDLSFKSQLQYSSFQKAMYGSIIRLFFYIAVWCITVSCFFLTELSASSWQELCQSC